MLMALILIIIGAIVIGWSIVYGFFSLLPPGSWNKLFTALFMFLLALAAVGYGSWLLMTQHV